MVHHHTNFQFFKGMKLIPSHWKKFKQYEQIHRKSNKTHR